MFRKLNKAIVASMIFGATLFLGNANAQTQSITVEVSPTVSNSINGHLDLKREKYINISANANEAKSKLTSSQIKYYFKDIGIKLGRRLGMLRWEVKYGSSVKEDANRPGFVDTSYLSSKLNPTDTGLDTFKQIFGDNLNIALHDSKANHANGGYPSFMPMYTLDNGHSYYPTNAEAHAEFAAYLMRDLFTDFQRPKYYELMNEPGWQYMGDQRFFDFHTFTKRKFDQLNLDTEVGGPCYAVGYYYKKNFQSMKEISGFIDGTSGELDFYSYHLYDFMQWNSAKNDFVGTVSSGLPTEAVFDALAAYTYNKFRKDFSFVGTEHGGYLYKDSKNVVSDALAAQLIGSGSGFEWELKRRSIDEFIMVNSAITNTLTFMNNPHIVKKVVPFIGLETSSWDPYYYASLLVKENFDKNSSNFRETEHVNFFKFFKDVKGRRVKSVCNDSDIQSLSFVDGNAIFMLFHNQSNDDGEIDVAIEDMGFDVTKMRIRRVGRNTNFRGYIREEDLSSLKKIKIAGQESCLVIIKYNQVIKSKSTLDTRPYYSTESGVKFTGRHEFSVRLGDNIDVEHAVLRVGIGRKATTAAAREVNIYLNGQKLNIPVENSAERLTDISYNSDGSVNANNSSYSTTRMVSIDPYLLLKDNKITVEFADGGEGGVGAVVIRAAVRQNIPTRIGLKNKVSDSKNSNQEDLIIYPNPAEDIVHCKSRFAGQLEVFNMNGKLLLSEKVIEGDNRINVDFITPGVYLFKMRGANDSSAQKLIIK